MIASATFDTKVGEMVACAVGDGICLLEFSNRKILNKELVNLKKYFKSDIRESDNTHLETLIQQLNEYFSGTRKEFSVPLVTSGTSFQEAVWKELLKIPYGTTRTYLEQSEALCKPGAVRAVAMANGMNRIAIIIPCHRVIGSDGNLTGYGGGIERKRWLLEHERRYSGKAIELSLF